MSLIGELKRRGVFRVALTYLAASWLLLQVAATVFPAFGVAPETLTILIVLLGIGFVIVTAMSWKFDLIAGRLRPDAGTDAGQGRRLTRSLDVAITVLLVAGISYFAFDKFVLDPTRDATSIQAAREAGRADAFVRAYGNRSIAVLPFVNMSSDPEQEYFSDGIAEELLNLLAKIPELRVISRSTAFTFKGMDIVVPEVAKKLNVAHILEGSVRRSGNQLRITAQLIDAQTDTHLWSETYDREMGDIFAIQDEISAKVVEQLKLQLLGELPRAQEIDPRAYDYYLRGRHLLHSGGGRAGNEEALRYLEIVVELEPAWVPGIAELLRAVSRLSHNSEDEYRARGWALLEQLERVDGVGARALGWRGWLSWVWLGETQLAAKYLERSAAIDPANPDLLRGEAAFLGSLGRHDEAMAISEYLIINDPGCQPCIGNLVYSLRHMGRPREAAERLESILEWHVPTDDTYWFFGVSWLVAGEPQKALEYFDAMSGPAAENLGRLLALHDLGRTDEFERDFARFLAVPDPNAESVARIYAWTGQHDEAFEWLEIMVEESGPEYAGLVKTDLYSKLADDPRWQEFLQRYGQNDEDLEHIVFNPLLPPAIRERINRD